MNNVFKHISANIKYALMLTNLDNDLGVERFESRRQMIMRYFRPDYPENKITDEQVRDFFSSLQQKTSLALDTLFQLSGVGVPVYSAHEVAADFLMTISFTSISEEQQETARSLRFFVVQESWRIKACEEDNISLAIPEKSPESLDELLQQAGMTVEDISILKQISPEKVMLQAEVFCSRTG